MGYLRRGRVMTGIVAALAGMAGGRLLTIGNVSDQYGYVAGSAGSLTPAEFLSSAIVQLTWQSSQDLVLWVSNSSLPNSGWETININGTVFLRTNASYSGGIWIWASVSTNPIGTSGTILVNIA